MDQLIELSRLAPLGTFAVAAAALVVSWINRRKIDTLHIEVNSRLTQLLEASSAAARAEGVTAGEQAQRDRSAPSDSERETRP